MKFRLLLILTILTFCGYLMVNIYTMPTNLSPFLTSMVMSGILLTGGMYYTIMKVTLVDSPHKDKIATVILFFACIPPLIWGEDAIMVELLATNLAGVLLIFLHYYIWWEE